MPQCKCGKTVEDWKGARGHVQWTDDETHGEKGDVPDDWKGLFSEPETDEDNGQEHGDDEADESPDEEPERDSGQSDGSDGRRSLREIATTPLDELLLGR